MKRLAYLMGTFPALTETFVLGEIQALVDAGVRVDLYSLRQPRHAHDRAHAEDLAASTHYGPPLGDRAVWEANRRMFTASPGRYLGALAAVGGRTALNPVHCLKSLALFPVAVAFAERMARDGVEHVHAHWANYPATAAYVVSRLLGIPFSITAHVYDATLIRSLMRQKIRAASFVVTCNAWSARRLAQLAPDAESRIALNYHGITVEDFAPTAPPRGTSPAAPFRIFSCGSLYPRKGFPHLLEACRLLHARGVSLDCVILGEGPMRPELQRFIDRHQLGDVVHLIGARPPREVAEHYRRADAFVLACMTDYLGWRELFTDPLLCLEVGLAAPFRPLTDGIPNVLVEAMAMQLPVVSTFVAGIPELIDDGQTGVLVPEKDPQALAAAIERLAADPEGRAAMAARGRALVLERFDRRHNIRQLVDIFARAGERSPARHALHDAPAR